MTSDLHKLATELKAYLQAPRVQHSLNVADSACQLARLYCPQLEDKARLAGLLHDNAKQMTDQELIEQARRFDIQMSGAEKQFPRLLHGKVAAKLLDERFGVDDDEVAQAVADHVTGRAGMGVLSLILFVADQAAADRDFRGVDDLRRVMLSDLNKAAWMVARAKLMFVLGQGRVLACETIDVYNELYKDEYENAG